MRVYLNSILKLGGVALLWAALPLYADNVQGPWGIENGDIFGRARTDQIPVRFQPGGNVELAWTVNLGALGLNRPGGQGYFVFDAAGNLYMRTSTASNTLASFTPDGTLRWRAHDAQGANVSFGSVFSASSAIVGDGAFVYVLGEGAPAVVAAVDKSTGLVVWQTTLPNEPVSAGGNAKTPVLYNGKLYVVGRSDGAHGQVYQVDSATGQLDATSVLPIRGNDTGSVTLVPDIFGPGQHGLYFNMSSGSGVDGVPEMYAVKVDTATSTATLAWAVDAGQATRSHVIYNPELNRLYTHTGTDFGAELYSFDPVTGAQVQSQNKLNRGHGSFDTGALDWDDASIVAGAVGGVVVKYTDDGSGATTDLDYAYSDWWGELRIYGQLLLDDQGHSILVTGTNSRCSDLGLFAEAVMLDITAAHEREDGPIWVDDVVVSQGPDVFNQTTIYSEDFEALQVGVLPGQGGWEIDNQAPGGVSPAEVVEDPFGLQGHVARLDAVGLNGGWQGIFHDFPDTDQDVVSISWKQYRQDLTDDIWTYFGNGVSDFSGGWTLAWDSAVPPAYFPYHFADAGGSMVPQATGVWQTVSISYRSLNDPDPAARAVVVRIDDPINGTIIGTPVFQNMGFNPTDSIRGFGIEIEGTVITTGGVPNPTLLEWVTSVCSDNGFPLRGGPLAGPDGKVYYSDPNTNQLFAVRANPCGTQIVGDSNCDGAVNNFDITCFVRALTGEADWVACAQPGCSYLCVNDINGDGSVNNFDIGPFVDLITGP